MPKLTRSTPKYRKHRASGQAIVTIGGRDFYLGPHGSKASIREYDRLIAEWLANGRTLPGDEIDHGLTIVELFAAYMRYARTYYRRSSPKGNERDEIKRALRTVKQLYGKTPAAEFTPKRLKAVRQVWIDAGNSRSYINKKVERVRRVFCWGVEEELVPAEVYHALAAVAHLKCGRTEAKETAPVEPVADAIVEATLPHLPEVVADMVQFQRLTGCRPGELCILRPCDVDRGGEVWLYKPSYHKTEHHGKQRVICIGPRAQDILRKYLLRPHDVPCFSPRDSEARRRFLANQARKTPLSCGNKPGTNRKRNPKVRPGERYTVDSYRRAIHRACEKAKIEKWSPNRLRHTAATEIRRTFDIEAARTVLGHSTAAVTEIYAERDLQKAIEVAKQIG